VFTVTLDKATNVPVTVVWGTSPTTPNWQETEGTAIAGVDYLGRRGIVTFAPGETTKTITIPVIGNTLTANTAFFVVTLFSAHGGDLGQKTKGIGTILAPPPPALSIQDITVTAGTAGTTNAVFTVTLSAPSGRAVTVQYATADGSAKAGIDYTPLEGTLTFALGQLSQTIRINVKGDNHPDPDETFSVKLASPTNATLARPNGVARIHVGAQH
jgi:Calx-beta domain